LDELRQTVEMIRSMEEVPPPVDLLVRIHRRLAERKAPGRAFWRVLSLPQTRVALAAALLMIVFIYGYQSIAPVSTTRVSRAPTWPAALESRAPVAAPVRELAAEKETPAPTPPAAPVPQDTRNVLSEVFAEERDGALRQSGATDDRIWGRAEPAPMPKLAAAPRSEALPQPELEGKSKAPEERAFAVQPLESIQAAEQAEVVRSDEKTRLDAIAAPPPQESAHRETAARSVAGAAAGFRAGTAESQSAAGAIRIEPDLVVVTRDPEATRLILEPYLSEPKKAGHTTDRGRLKAAAPAQPADGTSFDIQVPADRYTDLLTRLAAMGEVREARAAGAPTAPAPAKADALASSAAPPMLALRVLVKKP
jgi:hypothetical protein